MREMKGGGGFSTDWEETRHASLRRETSGSEHVLMSGTRGKQVCKVFGVFWGVGWGFLTSLIQRGSDVLWCVVSKSHRHQRNVWKTELDICEATIYLIFHCVVVPFGNETWFWGSHEGKKPKINNLCKMKSKQRLASISKLFIRKQTLNNSHSCADLFWLLGFEHNAHFSTTACGPFDFCAALHRTSNRLWPPTSQKPPSTSCWCMKKSERKWAASLFSIKQRCLALLRKIEFEEEW